MFQGVEMVLLSLKLFLKKTKDISDIDRRALSMYAKKMSQRDISNTIADIYMVFFQIV